MAKSSSKTTTDTKNTRQKAVEIQHRDLSTDEIGNRMHHMTTLLSLFDAQRTRAEHAISEATHELHTCGEMIGKLRADIITLDRILQSRRA